MTEIRANCEYQFKEFSISGEIAKSPPIKSKHWTFRDSHAKNRFYNRPSERKCDEEVSDAMKGPSDAYTAQQQYAKPFKKPKSDLRAEFFNAYKKYYRRVDIKTLQVQSTVNVDAKFKAAGEATSNESALYKEKECMEINIVVDTDQDDALVSGKVRRSVLNVPYGPEKRSQVFARHNELKHNTMINGISENLEKCESNASENCVVEYSEPDSSHDSEEYLKRSISSPKNADKKSFSKGNQSKQTSSKEHYLLSSGKNFAMFPNNGHREDERTNGKSDLHLDKATSSYNLGHWNDCGMNSRNDSVDSDSAGSYSDCSGKVEISESKYLDVWGPSLASLENESTKTTAVVHPKTNSNAENSEYVKKGDKYHDDTKVLLTSTNTNFSSYNKVFNGCESESVAEQLSKNEKYHKQKKGLMSSELSQDDNYIHKQVVRQSNTNPEKISARFCKTVANPNFQSDQINSKLFTNSRPINQHSHNSNLGFHESEDIQNVSGSLRQLNVTDKAEVQLSTQQSESSTIRCSGSQSAEGLSPSQATDELNNCATAPTETPSALSTGIRFRGLRGAPLEQPKFLNSIIINIPHCHSDNAESALEILDGKHFLAEDISEPQHFFPDQNYLEKPDICPESKKLHTMDTTPNFYGVCSKDPSFHEINDSRNISGLLENLEVPKISLSDTTLLNHATRLKENETFPTDEFKTTEKIYNRLSDREIETQSDYDSYSTFQTCSGRHSSCERSNIITRNRFSKNQPHCNDCNSVSSVISKNTYFDEGHIEADDQSNNHTIECKLKGKGNVLSGEELQSMEAGRNRNLYGSRKNNGEEKQWKTVASQKYPCVYNHIRSDEFQNYCYGDNGRRLNCDTVRNDNIYGNSCDDYLNSRVIDYWQPSQMKQSIDLSIEKSKKSNQAHGCEGHIYNNILDLQRRDKCPTKYCSIPQFKRDVPQNEMLNKKPPRWTDNTCLQIGPIHSLDYTPTAPKGYETSLKEEEELRCCGHSVNQPAHYYKDENATDCHCKRFPRKEDCKKSCPIITDNSARYYCHEKSPLNLRYSQSNEYALCGVHSCMINHGCYCESQPLRVSLRENVPFRRRNENSQFCVCSDDNPRLQDLSVCQCRGFVVSSWPSENERSCHPFNSTMFLNEEKINSDRSRGAHLCNYFDHCSIVAETRETVDRRNDVKEKSHLPYSDHDDVDLTSVSKDQWQCTATGHQPKRNSPETKNRYAVNDNLPSKSVQIENSTTNDQYISAKREEMKECNNDCYWANKWSCEKGKSNLNRHNEEFHSSSARDSNSHYMINELGPQAEKGNCKSSINKENMINFAVSSKNDYSTSNCDERGPSNIETNEVFQMKQRTKSLAVRSVSSPKMGSVDQMRFKESSFVSDHSPTRARFFSEEPWDSMENNIDLSEKNEGNSKFCSVSANQPSYLKEERWETEGPEVEENETLPKNRERKFSFHRSVNNTEKKWPTQRQRFRREAKDFVRNEDYRKCSPAHEVSDPSIHCEEQWESDEEKFINHKKPLTLPKNWSNRRRKRYRRTFNPKRWDMVTDSEPRNGASDCRQPPDDGDDTSPIEDSNFHETLVFKNRRYSPNN